MNRSLPSLLVALVMSAGCAAGDGTDAEGNEDAELVIELDDIRFEPSQITVAAGETLAAELHNVGGIVHDLRFDDGWDSGMIDPGRRTAVELGPFETTAIGWCSVPGHRDAGMELEVVVTR